MSNIKKTTKRSEASHSIRLPDGTVRTKDVRFTTSIPKVVEVLKHIAASEPSRSR